MQARENLNEVLHETSLLGFFCFQHFILISKYKCTTTSNLQVDSQGLPLRVDS